MERILGDAVAEEQTACFDRGAEKGRTDTSVEARKALGAERLFEAINGAGEAQRNVVGLGLQADFDGVEWVLNDFPYYTCCLGDGMFRVIFRKNRGRSL